MNMLNCVKARKQANKDSQSANRLVTIFNILSNINRFRIFRTLTKKEKLTDKELANILEISTSLVSTHLNKLVLSGVLIKKILDQEVYYSLNQSNASLMAVKTILL